MFPNVLSLKLPVRIYAVSPGRINRSEIFQRIREAGRKVDTGATTLIVKALPEIIEQPTSYRVTFIPSRIFPPKCDFSTLWEVASKNGATKLPILAGLNLAMVPQSEIGHDKVLVCHRPVSIPRMGNRGKTRSFILQITSNLVTIHRAEGHHWIYDDAAYSFAV